MSTGLAGQKALDYDTIDDIKSSSKAEAHDLFPIKGFSLLGNPIRMMSSFVSQM